MVTDPYTGAPIDCQCFDEYPRTEHFPTCDQSPDYDGPGDDYWCADNDRWYPPVREPYYDGGRLVRP